MKNRCIPISFTEPILPRSLIEEVLEAFASDVELDDLTFHSLRGYWLFRDLGERNEWWQAEITPQWEHQQVTYPLGAED
jgi:hypothetical protein